MWALGSVFGGDVPADGAGLVEYKAIVILVKIDIHMSVSSDDSEVGQSDHSSGAEIWLARPSKEKEGLQTRTIAGV